MNQSPNTLVWFYFSTLFYRFWYINFDVFRHVSGQNLPRMPLNHAVRKIKSCQIFLYLSLYLHVLNTNLTLIDQFLTTKNIKICLTDPATDKCL